MRRAATASSGISAMVSEVTASVKLAIGGAMMPSAVAMPMATKANSPPGPSSRPVSIAAGQGTRNSRARPMTRAALMAIRPATEASSQNGSRASSRRSIPMPTVKKNRPSSSPLKGSMVVSMALRYSVSASSRPATKAPSAMESPAMPAMKPVPRTTNSVAATNRSLAPLDATSRNSGRSSSRPIKTISPTASVAWASARARPASSEPPERAPRIETSSSSGTTARSCASRMAKLARPAVVVSRRWSDRTSMTMAVDDRARLTPSDHRRRPAVAEQRGYAGDGGRAQDDLQPAQPEYQPAHGDETLEGELQTDQEHQEYDAQLGDAGHAGGIGNGDPVEDGCALQKRAQAERPHDRAGRQVAEHRAHAPAPHDRHDHAGGGEHEQRVAVGIDVERLRGHGALWVAMWGDSRWHCA